jgi:hypothetical protein
VSQVAYSIGDFTAFAELTMWTRAVNRRHLFLYIVRETNFLCPLNVANLSSTPTFNMPQKSRKPRPRKYTKLGPTITYTNSSGNKKTHVISGNTTRNTSSGAFSIAAPNLTKNGSQPSHSIDSEVILGIENLNMEDEPIHVQETLRKTKVSISWDLLPPGDR